MLSNTAPSWLTTTLMLSLILAVPCFAVAPPGSERGADPDQFVPGQIVVRYVPGTSPGERAAALAAAGAELTRDVPSRDEGVVFTRAALSPGSEVSEVLARLREAARGDENMMPLLIEAVEAYATIGEICDVLREEWGEYQEVLTL